MQKQDLSYNLKNAKIDVDNFKVSVEVFSLENVYSVDEYFVKENTYVSNNILWGDTEKTEGYVNLSIDKKENINFIIEAKLDKLIRGVKLRFDDLPLGKLISSVDEDKVITEAGLVMPYPCAWRGITTPLVVFELEDKKYLFIRIKDRVVREKRFFIKKVNGKMRVDVGFDEDGTKISNHILTPEIEYGIVDDKEEIYQIQSDFMKEIFELEEYENNKISPSWLKDISLVVTMHMEAFTGHIFHTYDKALKDVEVLTKYIDGKKILVYLAGWEGRYYYKYGNYTCDSRLGGEEKLKEVVKKMQDLGCKVMAMYGMNIANKTIPAIKEMLSEVEIENVSGAKYHHGSVNWEGAHHYDFNDLMQLNIGNPKWQNYLYEQIKDATLKYIFDGAFLDIVAGYANDKNYSIYNGVIEFCDRLRNIKDEFLVSGEAFYDGLAKAMPLFQSGHTDGWMHYHDRVSDKLFTRYCREFAHLCLGDPSRGSSGVHELGTNVEISAPYRKAIIPTLSLVEDSIEVAFDEVKKIIDQANKYYDEFLK